MSKDKIVTEEGNEVKEPPKEKRVTNAQLQKEIEVLKEELANSKNDYFKAYADMENLKKRLFNEQSNALKYRISDIAEALLPSLDNLERALSEADAKDSLTVGVKMIYEQLKSVLQKEGVEEIEALKQPFDPNLHHAILTAKVKGVKAGIVVEELQKGYMLKDRILRASLVKVSE